MALHANENETDLRCEVDALARRGCIKRTPQRTTCLLGVIIPLYAFCNIGVAQRQRVRSGSIALPINGLTVEMQRACVRTTVDQGNSAATSGTVVIF